VERFTSRLAQPLGVEWSSIRANATDTHEGGVNSPTFPGIKDR